MAFTLSQTPSGDTAIAFAPEELDRLRDEIVALYGAIRLPWVSQGDLGFGGETFGFDSSTGPLRIISNSPKGAEMLKALAAKVS